jgi:ribonuclease HI
MPPRLKVFFDGGCRPNPGMMEIAVVAGGQSWVQQDIGHGTSEDAEWLALIEGLRIARSLGTADIILLGDAASVIAAANGTLKGRGAAIRHLHAFQELAATAPRPRIRHVKRSRNLAGIALARLHPR